jgi:uncharacterized protein YcbK (DUF882 family)
MGDLTKNFSKIEFMCKCGTCGWGNLRTIETDILKPIAEELQRLRDFVCLKERRDVPLIIHCGIRCPQHNKIKGGEEYSRHLPKFYIQKQGAADFHAGGLPNWKLRHYVKQAWKKGIISGGCGLYVWGCHVDTSRKRYWGLFWGKPK